MNHYKWCDLHSHIPQTSPGTHRQPPPPVTPVEKCNVFQIHTFFLALCDKNFKTRVCFRYAYFTSLLLWYLKETLTTSCHSRSYQIRKFLWLPRKRVQSGIRRTTARFSWRFPSESWLFVILEWAEAGFVSRLFFRAVLRPVHVLLEVFQHNQCHSHCTCIPLASFSLPHHVPSSSIKHSFALASPRLIDRIYCCPPKTFVLLVFILQSGNAMPIFFFFFLRFFGLIPYRAAFYIKGNG